MRRYALLAFIVSTPAMAVPDLTAHFHATVIPPTCDVTVGNGFTTGTTLEFVAHTPSEFTSSEPIDKKQVSMLVSCGAVVGKQVRITLTAAKTVGNSGNNRYLFNDGATGAATNVGYVVRLSSPNTCPATWAGGSSCEVGLSGMTLNIGTAGTALTNQAVWLNTGISRGGNAINTIGAGKLDATLTFVAAYP